MFPTTTFSNLGPHEVIEYGRVRGLDVHRRGVDVTVKHLLRKPVTRRYEITQECRVSSWRYTHNGEYLEDSFAIDKLIVVEQNREAGHG